MALYILKKYLIDLGLVACVFFFEVDFSNGGIQGQEFPLDIDIDGDGDGDGIENKVLANPGESQTNKVFAVTLHYDRSKYT